jgi:hypothetical protein
MSKIFASVSMTAAAPATTGDIRENMADFKGMNASRG